MSASTQLAKQYVDRMAELGGECDFVTDVAMHFPLYVILSLMGLPEEDYPRLLQLTQELFGNVDPELGRGKGENDLMATLLDFFEYFQQLIDDRRAHPRDDLSSVIANAEIDGEPIGIMEVGRLLRAHRDRRARHDELRDLGRPARADRASRPVRTAPRNDTTLVPDRGRRDDPLGLAGEAVHAHRDRPTASCTASRSRRASRCCCRTRRPTATRTCSRTPTRSTSAATRTGTWASASVRTTASVRTSRGWKPARCTTSSMPRLRSVELAGEPVYMETLFVGGPKHLPIRYELV